VETDLAVLRTQRAEVVRRALHRNDSNERIVVVVHDVASLARQQQPNLLTITAGQGEKDASQCLRAAADDRRISYHCWNALSCNLASTLTSRAENPCPPKSPARNVATTLESRGPLSPKTFTTLERSIRL